MENEIRITVETDEEITVVAPSEVCVCWRCRGEGKHVNPSIDGSGIPVSVFHEDPEFAEQYFSGAFDVLCEVCSGDRVTREINWDEFRKTMPEIAAAYELELQEAREDERVRQAELRAGA